jgi:hypothetical protein
MKLILFVLAISWFVPVAALGSDAFRERLEEQSIVAAAEVEISYASPKATYRIVKWLRRPDASAAGWPIRLSIDSQKRLSTWGDLLWNVHWRRVQRQYKGRKRAAQADWKQKAKVQIAMLRRARKRRRVRAVLPLVKIFVAQGVTNVLGMAGEAEEHFSLEHWVDHPGHGRWRKRLMRLLKGQ